MSKRLYAAFFTMAVTIMVSKASGQAITIPELEKVCEYTNLKLAGFAGSKQFRILPITDIDSRAYCKWHIDGNDTHLIEMLERRTQDGNPVLTYSIASQTDYLMLKSTVARYGYKYEQDVEVEGSEPEEAYSKNNIYILGFFKRDIDGETFYAMHFIKNKGKSKH